MITPPSFIKNSSAAVRYFDSHLSSGDYYESEGKTPGIWFGKGAEFLGLKGVVSKEDFLSLAKNKNPKTGAQLTDHMQKNRRSAMDFCIAPPKSVSIQAMVYDDKRIIEAHNKAVLEAAKAFEKKAAYRTRGLTKHKISANLCAAVFQHDTSRAAEAGGIPDPQLHSHLICFNATRAPDGSWKALQNSEMMQIRSIANEVYEHSLIQSLHEMGYSIRQKGKSWELAHIEEATILKFSKRRSAIEKRTKELEKQGAKRGHHELKDAIAHDERIRKDTTATASQLQRDWQDQLSEAERKPVIAPRNYILSSSPKQSVEWAKKHCFERNAVVSPEELLKQSIRHAKGSRISITDLEKQIQSDKEILWSEERNAVTTKAVLETEKYCIDSVRSGVDRYTPLAAGLMPSAENLTPIQKEASETILKSRDFAVIFKGGAGTGKSYTLKEITASAENAGKEVVVLAPQNKQVQGLQADGFTDAMTLSSFLAPSCPLEISKDSVIILDEAGQVGGEDMRNFISKVKTAGARIIFSGDTSQHGAVAASDALLAIEKYALPTVAELAGEEAIQRQKVSWYKSAVFAASKGKTDASFEILETQGAIIELEEPEIDETHGTVNKVEQQSKRVREVAKFAVSKQGSSLVVTQTNTEVKQLNLAIREELIAQGKLDRSGEIILPIFASMDATDAEKQKASSYEENTRVVFNRNIFGTDLKSGDVGKFVREEKSGAIRVEVGGNEFTIAQDQLDRVSLYEQDEIKLVHGDKIQLKANVKVSDDQKLANGSLWKFTGLDDKGQIVVEHVDDPEVRHTLPSGFKQFRYGYSLTSYSSQGATVDHVIISDSASQMATSTNQFYVSISRGRHSCSIFTSDKEGLKDHISRLGQRELATDLVRRYGPHKNAKAKESDLPQPGVTQRIRSFLHAVPNFLKSFRDQAGLAMERGTGLLAGLARIRDNERMREAAAEQEAER